MPSKLKIISGGQTGVDRAALDAALECGIPIGGFIPLGRGAEDGGVPSSYKGLTECDSSDPAVRTRLNVEHSDATLILSHGRLSGGSLVTWQDARNARKPCLHIDLDRNAGGAAVEKISLWLRKGGYDDLNIAGPRASKDPEIYDHSRNLLTQVFSILVAS